MTNEISKQQWEQFFEDAGKSYLKWETKGEVRKDLDGEQVLFEGLPLVGFFLNEKVDGESSIEIILGEESRIYTTYTIPNPEKVFFKAENDNQSSAIKIEDESGTETIFHLVQPFPALAAQEKEQTAGQA